MQLDLEIIEKYIIELVNLKRIEGILDSIDGKFENFKLTRNPEENAQLRNLNIWADELSSVRWIQRLLK